jgi:hypothetical protein
MGVFKKDNRWYIDYYVPDGKRKREIVTIPGVDPSKISRGDAQKALSIRKAQIAEGKFEIAQTKKPILFAKLESILSIPNILPILRASFPRWPLTTISSLYPQLSAKSSGIIHAGYVLYKSRNWLLHRTYHPASQKHQP